MIDITKINKEIDTFQSDKKFIESTYKTIINEKLTLEKEFTKFLNNTHHYAMQPEDINNKHWKIYKSMLKYYNEVEKLFHKICFFRNRHV